MGHRQAVDTPIKMGLGGPTVDVNIENAALGEKIGAGRHRNGQRETAHREDKAQTANKIKQNMFIIFLFFTSF